MLRRLVNALLVVRDLALTALVLVVASPLWFLPRRLAVTAGAAAGALGAFFWGKARRAGMINLGRAFPSLGPREARAIMGKVFANMGRSIAEGIQCSRRRDAGFVYEDPALAARIHADPRPKIFVTAHLGSWEVALAQAGTVMAGKGAVIVRAVDNPFLDAVVRRIRFDHPSQRIEKRGAVAEALTRLRAGESIAMLADENGGPRGPHVDFFGRPASTRKTPALLSLMTGSPIVVGAALRRPGAPLLFRLALIDASAEGEQSMVAILERINGCLERWIRDDVEQWRWIHWRWKTRPDGTAETYSRADVRACFGRAAWTSAARGEA